jgi:hypothetical protein
VDTADLVTLSDLERAREVVAQQRQRSVLTAALGGLLFSAVVAAASLWLNRTEIWLAIVLAAATYLLFGLPLLIHWVRHWRRIARRLSEVEAQVRAGEAVYGALVQFR